MIRMPIFLGTMLVSLATSAHHAIGAFYDYDNPRELEGTITDIRWINPHVRFTLETVNGNDDIGTPLGLAAETVETFELSDDGMRLDYKLSVNDPETFTAPFTLDGHWKWVPGEIIKPYNCAL